MDTNQLKSLAGSLKELADSLQQVAQKLEAQPTSGSPAKAKKPTPAKAKKPAPTKQKARKSTKTPTKKEVILKIIRRARKELDIATLKKRTGYDTRTINNAVYRLKKEKQITSPAKGVYRKI